MNLYENIKSNLKEDKPNSYEKRIQDEYGDFIASIQKPDEWFDDYIVYIRRGYSYIDKEGYLYFAVKGKNARDCYKQLKAGKIGEEYKNGKIKRIVKESDKNLKEKEYNYIKPIESKDINLNSALSILDEVDHRLVKDKHFELSYELSKVINLLNSLILSNKDLMTDKTKEELKKRYNEAANPANEEKNKIIRDALKGPKSYNKNLKALQKMGINKNSKEMEEDDYGRTIYLHGPNGRHVSVDPDGTNVWSTFSTRDEDHYKKELDFENRNSSNYNNQEHLDFNGKRAKDFDYYNYLHKPENKYQEEVDQANKVKGYRDNEDKTGYNLPDEALTPEEKSLNKRPRKYVQLSKDRKELEDELAGYSETKKQLDKVNRKIKKLHKK